jgi:uncharacterized protein (TIGR00730 family)
MTHRTHRRLTELHPLDALADVERVGHIAREALQAFTRLRGVVRAVSVFGSHRQEPADRWGTLAEETTRRLADAGFVVITGGEGGIMASANRGAAGHAHRSIGLTIETDPPEPRNPWVELEIPFHYFFLRKLAFVRYACGFVCFPGGFGTLDEMFEALNLVRTHRLTPLPVVLFGSQYWGGLMEWLRGPAAAAGCLTPADLGALEVTDDPAFVLDRMERAYRELVLPGSSHPREHDR